MNIDEIAKLAGVSKTTVSRVLNNRPDVSKETADRINALIKYTGYTPNAFAKAINKKQANTIGLVIPYEASYIFSNMYFVELLRGISTHIDERSYYLMLCYPKGNNFVDFFKQKRIDGFIIISPDVNHARIINDLVEVKAPLILTANVPCYTGTAAYVDIDDALGARLAVEHLISLGHRRIAYVGESSVISALRRKEAYLECLRAHDILPDETLLCYAEGNMVEAGYNLMEGLMHLPNPPTAVFFSTDMLAIGANNAAHNMGLHIPTDVSLVGFDDIFMSPYLSPPLTTVFQSAYDKGRIAAQILIDYLEDGTPMHNQLLDISLRLRSSTAPPNASRKT